MNSSPANINSKRLPSEAETGQRGADGDLAGQQLRLKERRFFEEVFEHDVNMYPSSTHMSLWEHRRPPIGSISSMEVNVDLLDQMELIEVSDQDAFDVFLSSGEEGVLSSPLPDQAPGNNNNNNHRQPGKVTNRPGLYWDVLEGLEAKSRVSSTSSESSTNSQSPVANGNGGDTPVGPSDEEGEQGGDEEEGDDVANGAAPAERDVAETPPGPASS